MTDASNTTPMPNPSKSSNPSKSKPQSDMLQGWRGIADFLAQPVAVVQRWAKSGMPVIRKGRRVYAVPADLNSWLARESSGEPVRIATDASDLSTELRRGLSYIRNHGEHPKRRHKAA